MLPRIAATQYADSAGDGGLGAANGRDQHWSEARLPVAVAPLAGHGCRGAADCWGGNADHDQPWRPPWSSSAAVVSAAASVLACSCRLARPASTPPRWPSAPLHSHLLTG